MPLNTDQNLEFNIISSVEAFLYANVVTPYNAAVIGTAFATPLQIIIDSPDDPATIATTPVITMELPTDYRPFMSTGMGDREGWVFKQLRMKCYPPLSTENGVTKPSITGAGYLRSLMGNINTALTIPLSDYSVSPATLQDVAYIDSGTIIQLHGSLTMLAMDKHRFDYLLKVRFPLLSLNG